jgi:hypothetical protein
MSELKIVRYQTAGSFSSVYVGTEHRGLIFWPLASRHSYMACPAAPLCDTKPDQCFGTEQEAIDYLS